MSNFIVRIKISMPDGYKTHSIKINALNLEDAMLRFSELTRDNRFIAVRAFARNTLGDDVIDREYGVVFPISSVLEAIYQEA